MLAQGHAYTQQVEITTWCTCCTLKIPFHWGINYFEIFRLKTWQN